LHTYWTASRVARGHAVGPEASCNKIFWSETDLVGQFEGTQRLRGAFGVEHRAHALAQRLLFVGECEVHDQPRGSPRRRSATTLR
jgi:hypothetical protein